MSFSLTNDEIVVRTLPTPNPMAIKFVINLPFKTEGKATFSAPIEVEQLPMLRDIFAIDGVKQLHVFQNTLTVTHSGELSDEDLSDQVTAVIHTRYSIHNPEFGEAETKKKTVEHQDPELIQIEEVLDRTIRPGLRADGGDIELVSLQGEELSIIYQGACGGCPSATMGTLDAIQGILREELGRPELIVTPI